MKDFYNRSFSVYFFNSSKSLLNQLRKDYLILSGERLVIGLEGIGQFYTKISTSTLWGRFEESLKVIMLVVVMAGAATRGHGQNVSATWGANGNSAWYLGGNWAGGSYAGVQGAAASNGNIATFTNAFTALEVGINMGTNSLNLGAVSIANTRITATNIGNSSGTAGALRLYGATVNSVANVIVRNFGTGLLTLQAVQNGAMGVILGNATNNIINTDASGGVTVSSIISGSGPLTKSGSGTGILTLSNAGNTYTGKTTINSSFININNEAVFGANPGSFVADQITLNGGGIQTNTSNVTFSNNRGITLGVTGGSFDVANTFIVSLQNTIAGSGNLTKIGAGILQLNKAGGSTLPGTNNVVVDGGTLQISTDQTLNDLSLNSGNLIVDNNVTLTINGTFEYFQIASITLGTGSVIKYGPTGTLKYSGTVTKTATSMEFPAVNGPYSVNSNNTAGVILPFGRTINGNLALTKGTFTIGANVLLELDGASLSIGLGYISGTGINNSTSDFTVKGITGGLVVLPTNVNIGLRNVTVGGSRRLALNGTNDLVLSGNLSIASGAAFDNGGESQITDGGTPVISINGTFITRDAQGFYGTNTSIASSINPTFNAGCTIEYGLATGNPQAITSTTVLGQSYNNITFSGSGTKTLVNAIDVNTLGTVKITGASVIVDASSNNIGSTSPNTTSFIMDNGRLIVGTTGTQPNMGGTYTITGGIVQFAGASSQTIRSKTYQNIEVTGAGVANSNGNITLNAGGTFIVKNGGAFTINDNTITGLPGLQTVTIEPSGVFNCGNNKGFYGFIPTLTDNSSVDPEIDIINLLTGSTVNYSRSNPPLINGDQVITGIVPYQNLILAGNGNKTAPASTLEIKGNFTIAGTASFVHNNGTVLINGFAAQSFAGLTYNNLHLDSTGNKTLTGNATILDSLKIGNLNSDPATNLELGNNYLTLKSTASKTARLATVAPLASISYSANGRFVVERNYTPRRAWRLVTAPITADAGKSIYNSWQMGGATATGSGTFVSGPFAPSNGLDVSPLNNYSLKTYDGTNLIGVDNTISTLLSGTNGIQGTPDNYGMFMFVRGDRSSSNLFYPPNMNETTLRDTGKVQVKTQIFTLNGPTSTGYSLVGNPFASQVDMNAVMASGININQGQYYMYDPYLNIDQGGYLTYTKNVMGVYSSTPPSPGGQTNNLHSSQAFYVQRTNNPATLIFTENNKTASTLLGLFRPQNIAQTFRANLYLYNSDISSVLADGIMAQFDTSYTNSVDITDAVKFDNTKENLALIRNSKILAVENRSPISGEDTLFLNLTRTTPRNYQFRFEPFNLDPLLSAFLEDSHTGTKTPLSLTSSSIYNFSVNTTSASAASDRFRVVFKSMGKSTLPVRYSNIDAKEEGKNIVVEWIVENELNIRTYEVEKSTDGINFVKVNSIVARSTSGSITYSWLDQQPVNGNNYYRIHSIDLDGKMEYSRIVKVAISKSNSGISVYPNPVTNGIINVQFKNMVSGLYNIELVNNLGQTILKKKIIHDSGNSLETFKTDNKLLPGIYQCEIITPGNKITSIKVMVK